MRRILVSAFLFAFLSFGVLAASASAQGDLDCDDFGDDQAAAQAYFLEGGGSPSFNFNRLDGDGNGIACEEPGTGSGGGSSADSASESSDDSGAVASDDTAAADVAAEDTDELPATGAGPVAGQDSTVLMTLIAAGALLCAGSGYGVRAKTRP